MHEMAIVQSMLDIALRAGEDAGAKRIRTVRVKMGEYSDVVPVIMREYFAVAAKGTICEGAEIEIARIPVTMRCRACGWEGRVDRRRIVCGGCGGIALTLLTGREFFVESLEAE
ncbi:MAG: hydrogenase maturation nickel metallochaperone HypA [Clostridia bacterium]|nr:hydrogenase maturation nickel metallochaperone HypA [Clostridia bacterium]